MSTSLVLPSFLAAIVRTTKMFYLKQMLKINHMILYRIHFFLAEF